MFKALNQAIHSRNKAAILLIKVASPVLYRLA